MKKINPYFDIYNEGEIIIQLSKDKDISEISDYINFLKTQKININLLDENKKLIYKYENGIYKFNKELDITREKIKNILLLENECKVLDKENNIIEFISKENLKSILEENHKFIVVRKYSNLYDKLLDIYNLLNDGLAKITLVQASGMKEELEGLGAGTMFVNLEKAEFKKLKNKEIFYQIYKEKIISGEWKRKKDEKIEEISKKYNVYEIDGTILGGYYLGDYEIEINGEKIKGQLLENLFASRIGGGIGPLLGEKIKEKNDVIFAYSKRKDYFTDLGFIKVEGKKSETGADLWMYEKS